MKYLLLTLLLSLTACSGSDTKVNTGLVATQDTTTEETTVVAEQAESVEITNNTINDQVPTWALWAIGGGIFCFALIIPSPFSFKGF